MGSRFQGLSRLTLLDTGTIRQCSMRLRDAQGFGESLRKKSTRRKAQWKRSDWLKYSQRRTERLIRLVVDEIGVGSGVVDRLRELDRHVIAINSSERSQVPTGYYNRRAEMWGTAGQMFADGLVQVLLDDKEGNEELSWMKFKAVKSNGEYQVEAKDEVKKRFGRSPDNADAIVYGLWAVRQAKPSGEPDKYERHARPEVRSAVSVMG